MNERAVTRPAGGPGAGVRWLAAALWVSQGCAEPPPEPRPAPLVETESRPLAAGLTVREVWLQQGSTAVLWRDGATVGGEPPVVAGRAGLARVFVSLDETWVDREVTGALSLIGPGGRETFEVTARVDRDSAEGDLTSTLNFALPAGSVPAGVSFEGQVYEVDEVTTTGGPAAGAEWSAPVPEVLVLDPLRIVLVPIRYDADGSGRLPDTSEARLALVRDAFAGMYPAPEVEVEVAEPLVWGEPVLGDDDRSWESLVLQIIVLRAQATEEPANTYFHGLVDPAETFGEYCQGFCQTGQGLSPPRSDIPGLRASVGVGFALPLMVDAVVHEVGHAHGRDHAPCGGAGYVDPGFPYADGSIGRWGWDPTLDAQVEPVTADLMSYCSPVWTSDYLWTGLARWMAEVSAEQRGALAPRPTWVTGADGTERPGPRLSVPVGADGLFVPFAEGGGGLRIEGVATAR